MPLLLAVALLSLLTQPLRRDASFPVALYLVAVTHAQHASLLRFGFFLLLASLAADAAWLLLLGPLNFVDGSPHTPPRLGLALSVSDEIDPTSHLLAGDEASDVDAEAEAVSAALAQLLVFLPLVALKAALLLLLRQGATATASRDFTRREIQILTAESPQPALAGRALGGLPTTALSHLSHAGASAAAALLPSSDTSGPPGLVLLGRALFTLGVFTALFRADASCALALLSLLATRESPLYFSRVLLGTAALALAIDAAWLHLGGHSASAAALLSAASPWTALAALPLAERYAILGTLASLPLKFLLAALALLLNTRQHATPPKAFRFDDAANSHSANSAADGTGDALAHKGSSLLTKSSGYEPLGEGGSALARSEARRRREVERRQLSLAKSLFTLSFLALAVGALVREISTYLSTYLPVYLSTHLSIHLPTYLIST